MPTCSICKYVPCRCPEISDPRISNETQQVLDEQQYIREKVRNKLEKKHIKEETDKMETPPSDTIRLKITEIANGIRDLLLAKNSDYGGSVFNSPILIDMDVNDALLVRMSDKIARIKNLISLENETQLMVGDEKLDDTLKDLAGYVILWLVANDVKEDKLPEQLRAHNIQSVTLSYDEDDRPC